LERKETELGQARSLNQNLEQANSELRELNKRLLRELERKDPYNDFTSIGRYPGQDIF
jgi:hypothetical protein